MPNEIKRFLDFGKFTLDSTNNVLLRSGKRLPLPPLAMSVLWHLVENRDRYVSREELLKCVWKATVNPNCVDQQIRHIRRALGQSADQLLQTRPKIGWQFVAPVTERTETVRPVAVGSSGSPIEPPPTSSLQEDQVAASIRIIKRGRGAFVAVLLTAIIAAVATATFTLALVRKPDVRLLESTPLTNDGREKSGPLLTDGRRIFFRERSGGCWHIVGLSLSNGKLSSLNIPLTNPNLQDISRDGPTLLLQAFEGDVSKIWAYSVSSRALRFVRQGPIEAAWAPDGRTMAFFNADPSSLVISEGRIERKIDLPGPVSALSNPKWSPDGSKLRFSLIDVKREWSAEWEIGKNDARPRRLELAPAGVDMGTGAWNGNGKYFLYYAASPHSSQDLWALRQRSIFFPFGSERPLRLTHGEPGSWTWPSPSSDESAIFALSHFVRSELTRFDAKTNSWQLQWDGAAAFELDYSKDCKWVVYTHYPDHTVWKAGADGAEPTRLTGPGLEAHQPHWSPDGSRIAYMGKTSRGSWRLFVVPANGGNPEEVGPSGEEQGVPTWSPDGHCLLFGDRLGRQPHAGMSIHLLDLSSRKTTWVAGSRGLWSPRWSPNGQYIAAVTSDSRAIRLLRWPGVQWNELVRMNFVDNATWSADSRYVYFNARDAESHMWLFRLAIPDGRLERLADLADFPSAAENWFGVAPDGAPLAFRGVNMDEIFALKCRLP